MKYLWKTKIEFVACYCLLACTAAMASQQELISWIVPDDGGTPRDPNRIQKVGPREYHIRASFEEGGASSLRHAVSRLDLLCRNTGSTSTIVTLHLDLSGDGKRTDYDTRPESGMQQRDFVFVKPPDQEWRQVDGTTEKWIATVRFEAAPGETKVGLSPWYTYRDYVDFIDKLPNSAYLGRTMIGKSDGGRDHWELTVTDFAVPAGNKRQIFWHAREHAYETFSSYAMEGLVKFLVSDEAAGYRRQCIFVIHPMTNPDGVANGFEYRGGYDFPKPRGTASARLTFDTMDRLRPDFVVAWHNWVAPRDRDVVFYTDGEGGVPTPRAWYLFTQKFSSPQEFGHRWKDENTPLRYNWHGRTPLSEDNAHQYAMKKYGTKVWGWEMPWWNRTPQDARREGGSFARAFLGTLNEISVRRMNESTGKIIASDKLLNQSDHPSSHESKTPVTTALSNSPDRLFGNAANLTALPLREIPRWEICEFITKAKAHVNNPYCQAALVGEFISPAGKTNIIDGFYDGANIWRLRFAPGEEGEWSYLLRGEGIEALQRGRILCTKPPGHGFIRIHPENPYAFAYDDLTPFFPMGDTCYGLFDDSPITPELRAEYLKTRRSQRFNFVRMTVGHSSQRAATDPSYWAWGGAAQKPDLDRLNPAFFQRFDDLMHQLRAEGMNVELILLNFYRTPFINTQQWTMARERLWLRYLMARYGAFDNIFLYTLANEYETHPEGKYRLDLPDDVNWVKNTAQFIKANNPYRHLVTVHPVISASAQNSTPRSQFDPPWRIGPFFGGVNEIDVLSQQTSAAYGAQWDRRTQQWFRTCASDSQESWYSSNWNEQLNCWTGDVPGVGRSIEADRMYKKPVLNTEFGYEYRTGHPNENRQVHHTDKVRRSAWRIVCAGGYFATGFHSTIGHSDAWNRIDPTNHYTFDIQDEGAATQLCSLQRFFADLPFWRMQPFSRIMGEAVALAEEGKVYAIYLPHGGSTTIDLKTAPDPFTARWFNPRIGKYEESFDISGRVPFKFDAPDTNDWALLLKHYN